MKNIRLLHLGLKRSFLFYIYFCACIVSESFSYLGAFTAKQSVSAPLTSVWNKMFPLYVATLFNPLWTYFKNDLNPVFLESDQSDYVTGFKTSICLKAEMKAKGLSCIKRTFKSCFVLVFMKVVIFEQWLEDINSIFFTMEIPQPWRLKSCEVYVKQGLLQKWTLKLKPVKI